MKRRKFLCYAGAATLSQLFLNGTAVRAFSSPALRSLTNCSEYEERSMVVIQLDGGNDGLNTLIPIEQYDDYANHRPTIKIDSNDYIELDSSLPLNAQVGLHPIMTDFKDLYDAGKAHIVMGTGYPDFNLSHFKSTDLTMSGGDGTPANFNINTGWMGRFLDAAYPGIAGNPTNELPDPLGIQLGSKKPSFGFHTNNINPMAVNLSGLDPSGYYSIIQEIGGAHITNVPNTEYGDALNYIMNVEDNTAVYAERISDVYDLGNNNVTYPDSYLANQLKTVARLIDGGSTSKIYFVDLFGFDTHVHQVDSGNVNIGTHADLLEELFGAVKAFQDDLAALGHEDKVLTVTLSEFGRRVVENGSLGTDHGTLAPMFIMGSGVDGGVTGINPDLVNLGGPGGNQMLNMQYDYREVLTTLLQDWLAGGDTVITETKFDPYLGSKIPFVDPAFIVPSNCYIESPLAIELINFTAQVAGKRQVLLEWTANNTHISDYFEIQKSDDGKHFRTFDYVYPNQIGEQYYSLLDEEPTIGMNYYRLKLMNFDKVIQQSKIETANIEGNLVWDTKFSPNPVQDMCTLSLKASSSFKADMTIINSLGGIFETRTILIEEGNNEFFINAKRWARGLHFITVISETGKVRITEKIEKI